MMETLYMYMWRYSRSWKAEWTLTGIIFWIDIHEYEAVLRTKGLLKLSDIALWTSEIANNISVIVQV